MNATYRIRAFINDRYELVANNIDYSTAVCIKNEYEAAGYYVQVVEIVDGMSHLVRLLG